MFITAAIFIALVTATSGHKLPQVKQDNFLQNADTDTLIEVLAKLMRISDNHHKIEQVKQEQATTCLDGLTLDQLQDLLGSLLGNSTNVYIITNDKKVFLGTSEIGLYFNLAADTTNRAATDIWISKPPCKECTTILGIFYGVFKKPNLHIETFNFDSTIMTNMGCLAKLQDQGFGILAWDWETFLSTVGVDDSQCSDAIRNVTSDSVYSTRKLTLKEFLDIFDSLCSEETIETWCSG